MPAIQPTPTPEPMRPVAPTPPLIAFAAYCDTCDWQGPVRRSNLTALTDHDRHTATANHFIALHRPTADELGED